MDGTEAKQVAPAKWSFSCACVLQTEQGVKMHLSIGITTALNKAEALEKAKIIGSKTFPADKGFSHHDFAVCHENMVVEPEDEVQLYT